MRVEVARGLAELCALEPVWDALAARDAQSEVFASFDWVRTWWESFGAGARLAARLALEPGARPAAIPVERAELHVLVIGEPARPAAIAPLLLTHGRWRRRPLRVLMPPLNAHAPRSGLLAEPGAEAPAAVAIARALAAGAHWDALWLDGIPRSSPALGALGAALDAALPASSAAPGWSHSRLPLEGGWDAYLAGRGRHFRKHLGQSERGLARLGTLELRCARTPQALEPALAAFLEIDADSWKAQLGESIGAHAELGAHYAALARRFARKGAAELWTLAVGGEPAAALLCLRHGDSLYALKTSFRRRFEAASYSPGRVLFAGVLQDAFGRGLRAFDFVGRIPFSERWTAAGVEFAPLTRFRTRGGAALTRMLERAAGLRALQALAR